MPHGYSPKPTNIADSTRLSVSASSGAIMMFSTDRRYVCLTVYRVISTNGLKCDTFSRSSDAVFELSLRFAEPFKINESLSPKEKIEAERLMFLELTQGMLTVNADCVPLTCDSLSTFQCHHSLPVGKFNRSFPSDQYDRGSN